MPPFLPLPCTRGRGPGRGGGVTGDAAVIADCPPLPGPLPPPAPILPRRRDGGEREGFSACLTFSKEVLMSPAVQIMLNFGLQPDPWQVDVLEGRHERLLLNCCRQGGKSTVVAILALVEAVFQPGSQILLLSRT